MTRTFLLQPAVYSAACCAAALLVFGGAVQSQDRFRAGVDVVRVDVLVMHGGRPVSGLTADDFQLLDQGVIQRVQSSTVMDVSISMLLALDTSLSVVGTPLARLKVATEAAVDALGPDDRAALLTFADTTQLRSNWGEARGGLRTAIQEVKAGGSTSLFDAVFDSFTHRDPAPDRRNLIVLFSDGADTSSRLPEHAVFDKARRTDTVVYSATLDSRPPGAAVQFQSGTQLRGAPQRPLFESKPFLEELAETTGGSAFVARGADGLRATFTRIVSEFRSRYLLTYTPEGVGGAGWHPIEVRLKTKKGRVTARRGYDR